MEEYWNALKSIENLRKHLKSTRVNKALPAGRFINPRVLAQLQQKHWKALKSIKKHWKALKSIEKHWKALTSIGKHCKALKNTTHPPPYTRMQVLLPENFRETSGKLPGICHASCYEARLDLLLHVFHRFSILYNAFSLIFNTFSRSARLLIMMLPKLLPLNFRIASGNFRGPQNSKWAKKLTFYTSV